VVLLVRGLDDVVVVWIIFKGSLSIFLSKDYLEICFSFLSERNL